MTTFIDMAGLSALPLTEDLLEHPAFVSEHGALVRAHIRLLRRAWVAVPSGTLLADDAVIAEAAGLGPTEFATYRHTLLSGWVLGDSGRLEHPVLAARAAAIWALHSEALIEAAAAATAVAGAPGEFQLTAPSSESGARNKGKRELPRNFAVSASVRLFASELGFGAGQIDGLFELFRSNSRAKGWRYKDWDAALRLFIERAPAMCHVIPERVVTAAPAPAPAPIGGARFGSLSRMVRPSRNETLDHMNEETAARVTALRAGRAGRAGGMG